MQHTHLPAAEVPTHLMDVLDTVLNYITNPSDVFFLCLAGKELQATCLAYLVNNSRAGGTLIVAAVQQCAHDLHHPKRIQPCKIAAMQQSQNCKAAVSWIQQACGNSSLLCQDYIVQTASTILTSTAQIAPEVQVDVMRYLASLDNHQQQQQSQM